MNKESLITKENLEKIGLKAWVHPTTNETRYYFNAKHYIKNLEERIISRSKDNILIESKIFYDQKMKLNIFYNGEGYLNRSSAIAEIELFIAKLIENKLNEDKQDKKNEQA